MKAVTTTLYVCGGLMATAAIMGFIDYKVAKHKGSLDDLYKEEKTVPIAKKSKIIDPEYYSRGPIEGKEQPLPAKEKEASSKQKPSAKVVSHTYAPPVTVEQEEGEEEVAKPFVKTRKKIRFNEFSRAPLPRKYRVDEETVKATVDTAEAKLWNY